VPPIIVFSFRTSPTLYSITFKVSLLLRDVQLGVDHVEDVDDEEGEQGIKARDLLLFFSGSYLDPD
jgi:hypothetical protein